MKNKKIRLILAYDFTDVENLNERIEDSEDEETIESIMGDKGSNEEMFYQSDVIPDEIEIIGYQIEGEDIVFYENNISTNL